MKTREQLIAEAQRQQREIIQYFNDVEHWNRVNPGQEIDPDPQGDLSLILAGYQNAGLLPSAV